MIGWETGIVDGIEGTVEECAPDEGSEFFGANVRGAGAAEDLAARFEAVGGGGEESHVGFFGGRELSLRGGETGRIGDDEVELHVF